MRNSGTVAILAFAMVAVAGVFLRPAVPIDETRYLAVAWEMWTTGDYLVPTKNFEIYSHKPPLLFWTINVVWTLTGVSEFAARLVGPGFAVLALLSTGQLARLLWPDDPGIGRRAVLGLAGLLIFSFFGGLTMFDAALAAATVGGMIALTRYVDTGSGRYALGLGAALAAGTLIKGPVILVHLMPALLFAPFWSRGRAGLSVRWLLRGIAFAFAAGLPLIVLWLLPAIIVGGPDYREAVLWTQSAGRVSASFAHARPWWFFLALLPLLLFPWIAVPAIWRAGFKREDRDPAFRLCLVWAGTALILFSAISGKQVHYLVPELPAVALLVARLAPRSFSMALPSALVGAVALPAMAVAAGFIPLGREAALIEPRAMLVGWALLMIVTALAATRARGYVGGVILTLGGLLSFNLLFGLTATRQLYDTHRISQVVAPFEEAGIAFYGMTYHAEFNMAARLTSRVANPHTPAELADWLRDHPDGVVVSRLDRKHPDWAADKTISFRNAPYAIWRAADAPDPEPVS